MAGGGVLKQGDAHGVAAERPGGERGVEAQGAPALDRLAGDHALPRNGAWRKGHGNAAVGQCHERRAKQQGGQEYGPRLQQRAARQQGGHKQRQAKGARQPTHACHGGQWPPEVDSGGKGDAQRREGMEAEEAGVGIHGDGGLVARNGTEKAGRD